LPARGQDIKPDFSTIADSIHEDISLLHDRDLYISGETIWFTASIKNSEHQLSKILYTELFNTVGQSVANAKFSIENNQVKGSLNIPEDIQSDIYFIRAYTRLLTNYPVESLFTYPITIVNPLKPFRNTTYQNEHNIELSWIKTKENSNSKTQLAFQIEPRTFSHVDEIYIEDDQKQKLLDIITFPNGLGKCEIPDKHADYRLTLILQNGDTVKQRVPPYEPKDISLNSVWKDDKLLICMDNLGTKESGQTLELSMHTEYGLKYYSQPVINSTGEIIQIVSDSLIKEGINFISLSDTYGQQNAIDVIYKPTAPIISVSINLDKQKYTPREQLNFSFFSPTPNPADIKLNVTVVKKGLTTNEKILPNVIIDNPFLLTSFLKNPANDYKLLSDQIEIVLNLYGEKLMMQDINNIYFKKHDFSLKYLPETKGVTITATVSDPITNKPVPQAEAVLSVISEQPQFYFNRSMQDGSLIFPIEQTYSLVNLYLSAKTCNGSPLQLKVNSDFLPKHPALTVRTPIFDENSKRLINEIYRNYQLTANFHKNDTLLLDKTDHRPFIFGNEMTFIKLSNYIELSSMEEIFKEIIPWAALKKEEDRYYFRIMDTEQNFFYENPLVLLDNVPVYDLNQIAELHPKLITKIGIINKFYLLGDYILWGVISIHTNTDNFGGYQFPKESVFLEYLAISKYKQFPNQTYATHVQQNSRIPDFRNVLYWNPELRKIAPETSLSLYSGDDCSAYEMIVRGFDPEGNLYFGKTEFEIK
jgi:hypothetical protein